MLDFVEYFKYFTYDVNSHYKNFSILDIEAWN